MLLADIIQRFRHELIERYQAQLLPGHLRALSVMSACRNDTSLVMQAACPACHYQGDFPHSCGHRLCPHCQHFESQRWIERQRHKRLPVRYFMITFTLPAQLRQLAFCHQRLVYDLLFKMGWLTLKSFGLNNPQLQGQIGATGILHTHARNGDYHPHVHWIVPAGAVDKQQSCWRQKSGKYLFNAKNLAKVFRAKWFHAMQDQGIQIKATLPKDWRVNVQAVGSGDQTIVYLGKYLYRGVIQEKDILSCEHGKVTFRYTDNSAQVQTRCLAGAEFLWLLLQHVLPKGFRRARDYGFLHANSKALITQIQLLFQMAISVVKPAKRKDLLCPHCGAVLRILAWRVPRHLFEHSTMRPQPGEALA